MCLCKKRKMAGNSLSVYLLVSVKKLQPKLKQPENCICPLNAVETINKKNFSTICIQLHYWKCKPLTALCCRWCGVKTNQKQFSCDLPQD